MPSPYSIRRETDSAVSELSYFEGHFVTSSEHLSTPSEPTLPGADGGHVVAERRRRRPVVAHGENGPVGCIGVVYLKRQDVVFGLEGIRHHVARHLHLSTLVPQLSSLGNGNGLRSGVSADEGQNSDEHDDDDAGNGEEPLFSSSRSPRRPPPSFPCDPVRRARFDFSADAEQAGRPAVRRSKSVRGEIQTVDVQIRLIVTNSQGY